MPLKPTIKQRLAYKAVVENGCKSIAGAMRVAGYSENTIVVPSKLTESDGWKQLLKEKLPNSFLLVKHKALLNKKDTLGEVDTQAVSKGLDLAYKLKGSYAPDKHESTTLDITSVLCSIIEGEKE